MKSLTRNRLFASALFSMWMSGASAVTTNDVPPWIPHDYSVDVTTNLQGFIDSVPDNSVINFPVLNYNPTNVGYRIEGTLTITNRHGLRFEGNGAFLRAFDKVSTNEFNWVIVRTRSQWRITGSNNTDIAFNRFVIYGANTNGLWSSDGFYDGDREAQNAFDITGVDGLLIDNCEMHNTYGDGAYIGDGSYHVTLQNCWVSEVGRQCIAPCGGAGILIQSNRLEKSRRGIIDIEPYAPGWSVDNVRIIGNTIGESRLICFPMGGMGDYGTIFIANNIATNNNGAPKIPFYNDDVRVAARRCGAFVVVNNDFLVGGSPAPGFSLKAVDGSLFAGNNNSLSQLGRNQIGVRMRDCRGASVVNNAFNGFTNSIGADALTGPVYASDNLLTNAGWTRQVAVTEFASNPACYYATVPYSDATVTNGRLLAIWRVTDGATALSHELLTTCGDYAVVKLDSASNLVSGFSLKGDSSYNGVDLPWLQLNAPGNLTATYVSSSQMTLSWTDNMPNESGFIIEQSIESNGVPGAWAPIGTAGANVTTYTVNGLQPDTEYYFRVCTTNSLAIASDYSNVAPFHMLSLLAPGNLSAVLVWPTEVRLSWTDNMTKESGFKIEEAPDVAGAPGAWTQIGTVGSNVTVYPVPGLQVGTKYYFRVRTYQSDNQYMPDSPYSPIAAVYTGSNTATVITQDWNTGTNGSAWPSQWSKVGTAVASIQAGCGQISAPNSTNIGATIMYMNTASGRNVDQLVKFNVNNTATYAGFVARLSETNSGTCYGVEISYHTTAAYLFRMVNGVRTNLASVSTVLLNTNYLMRFRVQDNGAGATDLKFKCWKASDSNEPSTWSQVVTDAAPELQGVSGRFGLRSVITIASTRKVTYDDYVATLGLTNTPPVAESQSLTTEAGMAVAVGLGVSDVNGDALSCTIVGAPAHGSLSGSGTNLTYTPSAGYNGPDSFTFKANDGMEDSNLATVSITVNAPVFVTEAWTGTNGAAWPSQWTKLGSKLVSTIVSNAGQMAVPTSNDTGTAIMYINTVEAENVEQLVAFKVNNNSVAGGFVARMADGDNDTYYGVEASYNTTWAYIFQMVDGVRSNLATVGTLQINTNYWMRFRVQGNGAGGTDLKFKLWKVDDPAGEPTAWSKEITNTTARLQGISGRFGLRSTITIYGTRKATYDDYNAEILTAVQSRSMSMAQSSSFEMTGSSSLAGPVTVAPEGVREAPGDFDLDAKSDPYSILHSGKTATWKVWLSATNYLATKSFRTVLAGGAPVRAADFDGDRKADLAMVSGGNWYLWLSTRNYQAPKDPAFVMVVPNGAQVFWVAADFDGDHMADPAMVLDGVWTFLLSGSGYLPSDSYALQGGAGEPIAADFDGDGKADPVMATNGNWTVWLSASGYQSSNPYAIEVTGANAVPMTGDYDGDGLADPAMVVNGVWTFWYSSSGYQPSGPHSFTTK